MIRPLPLIAALAVSSLAAHAHSFSISSVNGGAPTGSQKLNFDGLALGNATQWANADVQVSFSGSNTGVMQGAASGLYAAPYLSGGNGNGFGPGATNQADGADATKYLSAGAWGSVTLSFNQTQRYLGLLWGSVDTYNWIEFYDGASLVGSFGGSSVWAAANGNQGAVGTYYVNFNDLSGGFDKVVAKSSNNAFEFDNVAYNKRIATPDTASTFALALVGLSGLALVRRRR